jgi:hypothetical protein
MTIKRIQIVISALIIMVSAPTLHAGQLLFSDNFESGSLSGYTTQNVAMSTDVAYSGSHSVKCTHIQTVILRKELDMATMLKYNEVTIRYKWYTSSSWTTGTGVKYARLRTPSQELQAELWFSENLGSEPLGLGGNIYGSQARGTNVLYGSSQSFNKGKWMTIEIHYIYNSSSQSNGVMEVKFNGVQKLYKTDIGFRNNSNIAYNQFYLPSNIGTPNSKCINYIDDIEIWAGTPSGDSVPISNPGDGDDTPSAPTGLRIIN